MSTVDLHLHSTASDGAFAPSEVVRRAAQSGLCCIALTDHDNVDGVAEALETGRSLGVQVIPGLELSSEHNGQDIHLLGYFIDYRHPELLAQLRELRRGRRDRAEQMVACLGEHGMDLNLDEILRVADESSVGRAHIARALHLQGHTASVGEAFDQWLSRGGPCYVPRTIPRPHEAIAALKRFGAAVVLAHPGLTDVDGLVPELVAAGLDGIEVYHTEHGPETAERYLGMASQLGLVVTGGSDCHGIDHPRGVVLGSVAVPEEACEQLERAAGKWNLSRPEEARR